MVSLNCLDLPESAIERLSGTRLGAITQLCVNDRVRVHLESGVLYATVKLIDAQLLAESGKILVQAGPANLWVSVDHIYKVVARAPSTIA